MEQENIHKNRIGITVNGKEIKPDTWYANGVTYAPIREVANMLGASVEYNGTTQSADIVTESKMLELHGLKMQTTYYGKLFHSTYKNGYIALEFKITSFDPATDQFKGTLKRNDTLYSIEGKISPNKIVFKDKEKINNGGFGYNDLYTYELDYDGANNKFVGTTSWGNLKVEVSID